MSPGYPDPAQLHPMAGQPRVVLLRPLVTSPLIEVGEYTYYDDPDDATVSCTLPGRGLIAQLCPAATKHR
jgi:hypothetical protein